MEEIVEGIYQDKVLELRGRRKARKLVVHKLATAA